MRNTPEEGKGERERDREERREMVCRAIDRDTRTGWSRGISDERRNVLYESSVRRKRPIQYSMQPISIGHARTIFRAVK